jgi:hypothetical protein
MVCCQEQIQPVRLGEYLHQRVSRLVHPVLPELLPNIELDLFLYVSSWHLSWCACPLLSYQINSSVFQSVDPCPFVTALFATYVQQVTTWSRHLWIALTSARCWDTTLRLCCGTLLTRMQSAWSVLGHSVTVLDTVTTSICQENSGESSCFMFGRSWLPFSAQRDWLSWQGFHGFP